VCCKRTELLLRKSGVLCHGEGSKEVQVRKQTRCQLVKTKKDRKRQILEIRKTEPKGGK
jgi:hypothetical protein